MGGGTDRISTGVSGLDEVLYGGLIPGRGYLLRGAPGTGKTIMGLHYLTAGVEAGETVLFISLEEDEADVRANASALSFDLDGVEFLDLSPGADAFPGGEYDVFAPEEVESEPLSEAIVDRVESLSPDRVFVDPVTQLRYLTPDDYRFRKQVIAFVRFLREQGATVVFTSQDTDVAPDDDLQFLSDGTIELAYGGAGRTIGVPKFRGSDTRGGDHALRIREDGVTVYPRLTPGEHDRDFAAESISSGVPEVDELLDGGIERGTVTVVSGPTGVGKTTLGTQFMKEAAGRGERSVIYLFEEAEETFLARSAAVNIPVQRMIDGGSLRTEEIEALSLSSQEFAIKVRDEVEEAGAEIVMIDGVAGYKLSLRGDDEDDLVRELHSLAGYLKNMGVTTIMIDEVATVTGDFEATEVNISYLADNLVFLRHLEMGGELRKVIGVLKKRTSDFERTLREFAITEHGIKVGEPLTGLRGILRGAPEWVGDPGDE